MAAPKGNDYYKLRSKDGRDTIFKNPNELLMKCNEYFEWCLENPLLEAVVVNRPFKRKIGTNGDGKDQTEIIPYSIAQVPKMRPFTIEGLCNFIDIAKKTFDNYSSRKDFLPVITRIRQIIYAQKFEGAASGFLNANIIARDLGLKDTTETTITDLTKRVITLPGGVKIET